MMVTCMCIVGHHRLLYAIEPPCDGIDSIDTGVNGTQYGVKLYVIMYTIEGFYAGSMV